PSTSAGMRARMSISMLLPESSMAPGLRSRRSRLRPGLLDRAGMIRSTCASVSARVFLATLTIMSCSYRGRTHDAASQRHESSYEGRGWTVRLGLISLLQSITDSQIPRGSADLLLGWYEDLLVQSWKPSGFARDQLGASLGFLINHSKSKNTSSSACGNCGQLALDPTCKRNRLCTEVWINGAPLLTTADTLHGYQQPRWRRASSPALPQLLPNF